MLRNKLLLIFSSLLVVIFFINASHYDTVTKNDVEGKIKWVNIEEAQELSKKNPRKVFVDVYTNWCGWCKKMDKSTFADSEVAKYVNENYYAVKLNAESPKKIKFNGKETTEAHLARAMKVSGYPTIVLIDEKFETIQPVPGYRTAAQFKKLLKDYKNAD